MIHVYMVSIMGGGIVIIGMYLLIWGKEEARTNLAGLYLNYGNSKDRKSEATFTTADGAEVTTEP